jgi:hypothetical protein
MSLITPVREVSVRWLTHWVPQEEASQAYNFLGDVLAQADRRWNETDTINKLITPILTQCLGFPGHELHSTVNPTRYFQGTKLIPDLYFGSVGGVIDVLIEAKKVAVSLLRREDGQGGNFASPIEQGITYLDNCEAQAAIITNGWDWYLFRGDQPRVDGLGYHRYFGIHIRLDIPLRRGDLATIGSFLALFHKASIMGQSNEAFVEENHVLCELKRPLYEGVSEVYYRHFVDAPLYGHGSGFQGPKKRFP